MTEIYYFYKITKEDENTCFIYKTIDLEHYGESILDKEFLEQFKDDFVDKTIKIFEEGKIILAEGKSFIQIKKRRVRKKYREYFEKKIEKLLNNWVVSKGKQEVKPMLSSSERENLYHEFYVLYQVYRETKNKNVYFVSVEEPDWKEYEEEE